MNAEISTPTDELTQRLSATPRGARLARRLTAAQLETWGHPHDSEVNDTAQHLVAELAANAVTLAACPEGTSSCVCCSCRRTLSVSR